MPQKARTDADAVFLGLLEAQERLALAQREHAEAKSARDAAIFEASRWGFPRRAVAQAANVTVGRVQQIVSEHGGTVGEPSLLPAGKRWRYPIGDPRRYE